VDPRRQTAPHPHAIVLDAAECFAFVPDLGLDQIKIYKFDPTSGTLVPNQPPFVAVPPGSGPRHFLFHPNGKFAYASLELASEAIAFRYDAAHGTLEPFQTLPTLPEGFSAMNTTAGICIAPDGRFLYISNRGHNSIALFAIDPTSGKLSRIGNASTGTLVPHAIGMDPSGRILIATDKNSGETGVFKIDRKTGQLARTDTVNIPKAGSVAFSPKAKN
jgi:6-phosphogluconolactonase